MSSAARTNLTSNDVRITNRKLGDGTFRVCLEGFYVGGNRNQQEAACKRFKPEFRHLEDEFFDSDFNIIDKTIEFAEYWNQYCDHGKEIVVNRGSIHHSRSGIAYLVEPLIRYYRKFTSNCGWIGDTNDWHVRTMEAFSHYSYHRSGGQLIVCDIQGRYRHNRYSRSKSRFELTDPAICSRPRLYSMALLIWEKRVLIPFSVITNAMNFAKIIGNALDMLSSGFRELVVHPCYRRQCLASCNSKIQPNSQLELRV